MTPSRAAHKHTAAPKKKTRMASTMIDKATIGRGGSEHTSRKQHNKIFYARMKYQRELCEAALHGASPEYAGTAVLSLLKWEEAGAKGDPPLLPPLPIDVDDHQSSNPEERMEINIGSEVAYSHHEEEEEEEEEEDYHRQEEEGERQEEEGGSVVPHHHHQDEEEGERKKEEIGFRQHKEDRGGKVRVKGAKEVAEEAMVTVVDDKEGEKEEDQQLIGLAGGLEKRGKGNVDYRKEEGGGKGPNEAAAAAAAAISRLSSAWTAVEKTTSGGSGDCSPPVQVPSYHENLPSVPSTVAEMGPFWVTDKAGGDMSKPIAALWVAKLKENDAKASYKYKEGVTKIAIVPKGWTMSKILEAAGVTFLPPPPSLVLLTHEWMSEVYDILRQNQMMRKEYEEKKAKRMKSKKIKKEGSKGIPLASSTTTMMKGADEKEGDEEEEEKERKKMQRKIKSLSSSYAPYVWSEPIAAAVGGKRRKGVEEEEQESEEAKRARLIRKYQEGGASDGVNHNPLITEKIKAIAKLYELRGGEHAQGLKDSFNAKHRTYLYIATAISCWPRKLKNYNDTEDFVRNTKGVGKGALQDIDQIVSSGGRCCDRLDSLRQEPFVVALLQFMKIWGVGKTTAETLYRKGLKNIDELQRHGLKHLDTNQKIGLKYYDDLQCKIPRNEVEEIIASVRGAAEMAMTPDVITKADGTQVKVPRFELTCCGSYRRGKQTCGDVDILLCPAKGQSNISGMIFHIVYRLENEGFLTDALTVSRFGREGDNTESYMGICCLGPGRLHRRIDIKAYPRKQYPFAILYFTGSGPFNQAMRTHAINSKGLSLSDKELAPGLWRDGKKICNIGSGIPCETEEDIFAALDLKYRRPDQRETIFAVQPIVGSEGEGGGAAAATGGGRDGHEGDDEGGGEKEENDEQEARLIKMNAVRNEDDDVL